MSRICEEADGNTCLYSKGIDSLPGGGDFTAMVA